MCPLLSWLRPLTPHLSAIMISIVENGGKWIRNVAPSPSRQIPAMTSLLLHHHYIITESYLASTRVTINFFISWKRRREKRKKMSSADSLFHCMWVWCGHIDYI